MTRKSASSPMDTHSVPSAAARTVVRPCTAALDAGSSRTVCSFVSEVGVAALLTVQALSRYTHCEPTAKVRAV